MGEINQKECISINCSKKLDIFNNHFRYPVIDEQETYNGPTDKVIDIQAHAWKFQNRYKNSTVFASSVTPPKMLWGAPVQRPTKHYMEGHIIFDHGLPAVGITIRLYSSNDREANNLCLT